VGAARQRAVEALFLLCSAVIPEDDVPLIMSNAEGWTVRFCDKCMEDIWGLRS
jgi:hypothetical protein